MNYRWDWQFFFTDNGGGVTYLQWLISAWGWTATVAFSSLLIAVVLGAIVGVLRTTPKRSLVWLGSAWTEIFRNIPLLVQIFIWYHVLPAFFPALQQVSSVLLVIFALGLFTSARISEQVRAGIQSIPSGQKNAGLALGFTMTQVYRYMLLPMAMRIIIPPLTSESMSIVKNSAVAFAVSVAELSMFAMQAQEETSRGFEIYLVVTLLYFFTAFCINRLLNFVEKWIQIPGMINSVNTGGH